MYEPKMKDCNGGRRLCDEHKECLHRRLLLMWTDFLEWASGRMHGWMDQSIDPKLTSPQNVAGTKINEIITRHMLISKA